MRTRSQIFHRFNDIKDFRNRVSHHEPIWDRDLESAHRRVLDTLGWINMGLANAIRGLSPFDEVLEKGPSGYRPIAERLVKLDSS